MKKLFRTLAAAGVTVVAAGSLSAVFAGSAFAAGPPPWETPTPPEAGGLLFFNSAGQEVTSGTINQPLAAYAVGTATLRAGDTKAYLAAYTPVNGVAPGGWSGQQLSLSTAYPNGSAPAPVNTTTLPVVTGPSSVTSLFTYIGDFPNGATTSGYEGIYVLRLYTSTTGQPHTTAYDSADISVSGTTWTLDYTLPQSTTPTTTSLGAVPASPQPAGTTVALTATVTPSGATGTVQFEYGTTDIGGPVTVSGGTASISTTSLPVGSPDSLSAVFTAAPLSGYGNSTGTASYTVTPPPATGTTTGLTVDPNTAPAYTAVGLTASVTNSSTHAALTAADGSVSFYDDGSDNTGDITSASVLLGTEPLGSGGVASLTYSAFAQGPHNIVAKFNPTDPSTYSTSTSPAVLFTATAPTYTPDQQDLSVTIPVGTLTITTPYTPSNPFNLGTATLNAGNGTYSASAAFGSTVDPAAGVTITDTGIGEETWTASASTTDFTNGGSDSINGQNLTFTGVVPNYITGNNYGAGAGQIVIDTQNVPNSGTVYAAGASGTDGLKGGPHQFADSTAAGGGSVYVDGNLNLTAPSSVTPGTYTATLTFTVA